MAVKVIRKFRLLHDVTFGTPADQDVVTYDAGTDKLILAPSAGGGGGPPTGAAGGVLGGTYPNPSFAADMATQAELDAHESDTSNVHGITDTTVLATDSEVATAISTSEAGQVRDGDAAGGVLGGTYPNPSFAADMATQAELDAHVNDVSAAHAASAIGFTPNGSIAATDVQAAIQEVRDEASGGGAPSTSDYLVGTADGGLSNEIVVGTSPGGELGGTWASPTVDTVHSGSSHAQAQAAAEATAAAALGAHVGDATDAHAGTAITNTPAGGIAATTVQAAINELDSEKAATASAVMDGDAAGGVLAGTYPNPSFAADMATQTELDAHINDTVDAHDASAISFSPTGTIAATDVQGAIAEVASEAGSGGALSFIPTFFAGG